MWPTRAWLSFFFCQHNWLGHVQLAMAYEEAAATQCWQQVHLISLGWVALQVESRAAARSAWTVSLTAWACFNLWGAYRARGSGLKQHCALEEAPVVYSNEHSTSYLKQRNCGTVLLQPCLEQCSMQWHVILKLFCHQLTVLWKYWWDGSTCRL